MTTLYAQKQTSVISPPLGACIITIKATVNLDQEWQAAVNAAGPNTPADYSVRKVGNLYLPTGTGVVEEEFVLLNYPNGDGDWSKALAWAAQFRLKKTGPRRVFAIGEGYPKLNYEIGPNPAYVVATEECSFDGCQQACSVWWGDSRRRTYLLWVSYYGGADGWFAFRK